LSAPEADTEETPTHGTVNVLLTNKNGLVVLTDSALSDGQKLVGYGPKLFQIDNKTVCSIAGWYSDPGLVIKPDNVAEASYPVYMAVPGIIQTITSRAAVGSLSNEEKMKMLSGAFKLSLLLVANVYEAAGVSRPVNSLSWTSEITLAGFDDKGMVEILQADLVPAIQDGKIRDYDIRRKPTVSATQKSGLISVFRGIEEVARSIQNGTYPSWIVIRSFHTSRKSLRGTKELAFAPGSRTNRKTD
jgi:hypothetical protein